MYRESANTYRFPLFYSFHTSGYPDCPPISTAIDSSSKTARITWDAFHYPIDNLFPDHSSFPADYFWWRSISGSVKVIHFRICRISWISVLRDDDQVVFSAELFLFAALRIDLDRETAVLSKLLVTDGDFSVPGR